MMWLERSALCEMLRPDGQCGDVVRFDLTDLSVTGNTQAPRGGETASNVRRYN